MKKYETCTKCNQNYSYCLVCLSCDKAVCYQCSLHLVDKIEGFFCCNKCVYDFTEEEYSSHGNGD